MQRKTTRPLTIQEFTPGETPKDQEVIVPTRSFWTNPITIVLGLTILLGALNVWFDIKVIEAILPGTDPRVAKAISDTALTVIVPAIVAYMELQRKALNTLK